MLADGDELPFDLFLGVPVHRAPAVVVEAGLTVDGWIPVDPLDARDALARGVRRRRRHQRRYPEGRRLRRATGLGRGRRDHRVRPRLVVRARYDGRGICYVEFGRDNVALVDVTFVSGQTPTGSLEGPSAELAAAKAEFGSSRVERWFGAAGAVPGPRED